MLYLWYLSIAGLSNINDVVLLFHGYNSYFHHHGAILSISSKKRYQGRIRPWWGLKSHKKCRVHVWRRKYTSPIWGCYAWDIGGEQSAIPHPAIFLVSILMGMLIHPPCSLYPQRIWFDLNLNSSPHWVHMGRNK